MSCVRRAPQDGEGPRRRRAQPRTDAGIRSEDFRDIRGSRAGIARRCAVV